MITIPAALKPWLSPKRALPIAAVVLSLLLLFGVVGHANAVANGREVIINARGYDPRDVLLGHYVRVTPDLQTEIVAFDLKQLRSTAEHGTSIWNQEGWAILEHDGLIWQLVNAYENRPRALPENLIAIKADISATLEIGESGEQYRLNASINVNRIYANQREALDIEDALRGRGDDDRSVELILSVTPSGEALVKGLVLDGERKVFGWW